MSWDGAEKRHMEIVEHIGGGAVVPQDGKDGEGRYENLKVTKDNKVLRILLNKPLRKNALTSEMCCDLASILREAAEDEDICIATITGAGDYYCSGNDIAEIKTSPEDSEQKLHSVSILVKAFIDFPKVLIALVNGPAIGISVSLMGLCDAVYCSDNATFLTPFTHVAHSAEACSSYIFPKIMGEVKAREMLMFNKKITAQEAYERNLVTRVFPAARFQKETDAVLAYLASLPPKSLLSSKMLIRSHEKELLHTVNDAELKLIRERGLSEEIVNAHVGVYDQKESQAVEMVTRKTKNHGTPLTRKSKSQETIY